MSFKLGGKTSSTTHISTTLDQKSNQHVFNGNRNVILVKSKVVVSSAINGTTHQVFCNSWCPFRLSSSLLRKLKN
jgi:hypothetical protein